MVLPLMLAAGDVKTAEHVKKYAANDDCIAAITAGSFTRYGRDGNRQPNFVEYAPGTWINALGLPNGGLGYLKERIEDMIEAAGKCRLRISIAPIEPGDLAILTSFLAQFAEHIDLEVNFGCPNVWDGGVNKPLICLDPDAFERALAEVMEARGGLRVAAKISPMEMTMLERILSICHRDEVDEIVSINTLLVDAKNTCGVELLSVPKGGISGSMLADGAVAQASASSEILRQMNSSMALVGCGGISSAAGVKRMEDAGANAAMIGTYAFIYGPRVFVDITIDEIVVAAVE